MDVNVRPDDMERITTPELAQAFIDEQVAAIREQVGDKKVLLALSGGVDSSVVAALLIKAIGKNLVCVHVNHGLMRKGESEQVIDVFQNQMDANLVYVDATDRFLNLLADVDEPETKRKIIGGEFIRVFEEEARKVGDEVEVEVLDVDLQRERISLGLKQTTPDPWIQLVENYPVGTIVDGKVTKIVPFGAFVELGDSIEGLVHISEMAGRHIDTPAQVVHAGDDVKVKVMEINPDRRRISLSMKAAAEELGFEIDVDESVQAEEKPARRKKDEAPAEAEVVEVETVDAE